MSTPAVEDVTEEVDPSLDIRTNEERLATTRRVSRIVTEQSVQERLARKLSKEKAEDGAEEVFTKPDGTTGLDDSVNIEQTEQKLFKARRVSQHSYKERLSQKRGARMSKKSHSNPNEEDCEPSLGE